MTSPGGRSHPNPIYVLDSSVLILSLRGDIAIRDRIAQISFYIPSIVIGELYTGAFVAAGQGNASEVQRIDDLAAQSSILVADAQTSRQYGRIKSELRSAGRMIPDNDLWIAAISVQYGLTLAARDTHFDWVNGLLHEQW